MAELTYTEISDLLKYEPETGKLYWLERPVEMFTGGGKTSQSHIAGVGILDSQVRKLLKPIFTDTYPEEYSNVYIGRTELCG